MKLPNFYEFEPLNIIKSRMGIPRNRYGDLTIVIEPSSRLTELELEKLTSSHGLDIPADDLTILPDGTLAYKNSRVLLYIRDSTVTSSEPRFHLAHCRKLKGMRKKNKFDRYVVSTNTDGEFSLNIIDSNRVVKTEIRNLSVCQHCLAMLKFNGFNRNWERNKKRDFVSNFNIGSFFEQYPKSLHTETPRYNSDNSSLNVYTDDFKEISKSLRSAVGWCCQQCGISLSTPEERKWLHVHHKNGLKHDNSRENLAVLCIGCHAEEPGHAHMKGNSNYLEFLRANRI